jgi:ribosome-binding protein aMBF1 (putative translation factor)
LRDGDTRTLLGDIRPLGGSEAKNRADDDESTVLAAYFSLKTGAWFSGTMRRMTGGLDTVALRAALAEHIRRMRKKRGLSQEELAWRSGLHRTYISMIERSQRSVTIDSLEGIAVALGVSASALLARAERSRKRNGPSAR